MSMTEKFGITFGALAPSLAEQLDRKPKDVELWQKHADAICRLSLHGLLSEAETRRSRLRLLKVMATASAEPRG